MTSTGALRRFARQGAKPAAEVCDLCGAPIAPEHRHLLDTLARQVQCACYACSVLFDRNEASHGKLRLIPDRRLRLTGFQLSDAEWAELHVPVGLAFITWSAEAAEPTASYPAPLGATQAGLDARTWRGIVERNPLLSGMAPDVEALLINRVRTPHEYYLVPIDECFRLVATLRMNWRGLTGGGALWRAVDVFFEQLREKCTA